MISFLKRHYLDIKTGGRKAFFSKLNSFYVRFSNLTWLIASSPIVLLIRVVSPFFTIILVPLDLGRIGHWYNIDYSLTLKRSGKFKKPRFYWYFHFCSMPEVCNQPWVDMWSREVLILPFGKLFLAAHRLNSLFPMPDELKQITITTIKDLPNIAKIVNSDCKQNISFTKEEAAKGNLILRNLGIEEDDLYICFHCRDSAYLNEKLSDFSWNYHDHRDSSIRNYIPAMEIEASKNIRSLRMGEIVKDKIPEGVDERIIDYAVSNYSDPFADLYISSKCKLFVASDTGITILPEIFRRPIAVVNYVPIRLMMPTIREGIFIPKSFHNTYENRQLTFYEIFDSELSTLSDGSLFEKLNVEVRENTPEQIIDIVHELNLRIDDKWVDTEEDIKLQKMFWEIFNSDIEFSTRFTISTTYLRKNKHLLNL